MALRTGGGGARPTSGDDVLNGTTGADTISGLAGNDTISGLAGNDTLAGNAGADTINGGDGNDTIYGGDVSSGWSFPYYNNPFVPPVLDHGSEVDTLNGGAGDDAIIAGYGDNVDGGDGYDNLFISFQGATSGVSVDFREAAVSVGGGTITNIEVVNWVEGSNFDDTIIMSDNSDVVLGMGGNDTLVAGFYTAMLDGGDGDDIVDGRNGGDYYLQEVDGGAGNDTLYTGTNSRATANGGDGNDTIYGQGEIHGGNGDDTIHIVDSYYLNSVTGDDGNDTVYGSDNPDDIDGGAGNDLIDGGAGDDKLIGGLGDDALTGGAGADRFIVGPGHDTITDLDTTDIVEIDGYQSAQSVTQVGSDVVVVLSSTDQITFSNTDVASVQAAIEFGPPTDDVIGGTPGDDTLYGYGGNDTISGYGGNDVLYGGAGYDTLAGGAGSDTIYGGTGGDVLYSGDVSPPFVFPYYGNPYTSPVFDRGTEVDTLNGGAGDDVIFAGYGDNVDGGGQEYYGDKLFISFQGATTGVHFDGHLDTQTIGGGTITGIENISWVEGSNYDDYIDVGTNSANGYSNFTVVQGMAGDDTLIAGYYTSVLDGGDGNDIVDGRNSPYLQEADGGAGDDTIYVSAGHAVANGGDGNDTIYAHDEAHGGSGDDTIYVATPYWGTSEITGDGGNDTIMGSSLVDHIDGGTGNDTIDGGAGNDVLKGGAGDDVLTGGAGNDQFFVGDGNDVITDFSAGDGLHIQVGFSADSISQVGSDVVIALTNGNQLTLQNTDVASIKTALESSVKLNDIAISADGSTIYGAGDDGNLYVYDAATGEFLRAVHVGTELGGMDVSPDGTFAIVTELQPLESHYGEGWPDNQFTVTVYKVDLATGQVTSYPMNVTGDNYSFYDAAVLSDGKVMLSEQILPGWSGGGATFILDPSTGTYTEQAFGGQDTVFSVSADGKIVLLAPENISDGPLSLYGSGQGLFATHDLYQDGEYGFNRGIQAISDSGNLIAQSIYGDGLNIYDSQLHLLVDLCQAHPNWRYGTVSGLAFDHSGQYLFVLDNQTDKIVQLSTADWSVVAQFDVGADITSSDGKFGDRLLVAPDMSYFLVQTDAGGFVKVAMPSNTAATAGDDFLFGTSGNDTIGGLAGNDAIYGSAGSDTLGGGDGNDKLTGGSGNDTLTGGAGNDTFLFETGDGVDVVTDFAAGDVVKVSGYETAQSITQVGADVVVMFAGGDQITLQNTSVSAVQAGLQFGDVQAPMNLVGTSGDDTLTGGSGNDNLSGGAGNDVLDGKGGADSMTGGLGNDVFYVDNAGDVVTETRRGGTDEVRASVSYTLAAGVEVEKLTALGTGAVNLTGNATAQTIQGNDADNFLYGLAGNDKLIGAAGNDTLRGGLGTDTLTGGLGADLFVFEKGGGNDKVTDFVSGTDKIDLHLLGITSADVKTALSGGNTIVSVDANHDGRADFTITLTGVAHVDSGDFIFV